MTDRSPARRHQARGLAAVVMAAAGLLSACSTAGTGTAAPAGSQPAISATPAGGGSAGASPGQPSQPGQPDQPDQPSPPSEAGTALAEDAADGLSLTLPAHYVQLTSSTTPADLIRQGVPAGPTLAATLTSLQGSIPSDVAVFAVDFSSAASTRFANNVNVDVRPAGGAKPGSITDDYAQAAAQLATINATPTSSAKLTVAGVPALRVDYRLPQAATTIEGTQIYFIHDDKIFVTTISMAMKTRDESTVDAIIAGLRLS